MKKSVFKIRFAVLVAALFLGIACNNIIAQTAKLLILNPFY